MKKKKTKLKRVKKAPKKQKMSVNDPDCPCGSNHLEEDDEIDRDEENAQ